MNWPVVKIDSIKSQTRYSFVGGPFGSNLTTRDYTQTGVPIIRGVNLPDSTSFLDDEFVFVSDRKADLLLPNNAHPGDIIFTQRGTLGQVGLIPNNAKYERYVISQSQMKLTVDKKKAFAPFVYYFFRLPAIVEKIKAHTITSGVPHINLGMLKGFEIPLPPVETQQRIAAGISAYDDLITANQRRIQLLEESARLLYRTWFVNLRFPGHETVPVSDGVPNGWCKAAFSSVADFVNGFAFKPVHLLNEGLPIVKIPELRDGVSDRTPRNSGSDVPSKYRIVTGDLLFSWSGTLLVNEWSEGDALLNQHLFKVIPKLIEQKRLIRFALENAIPQLQGQSVGATMQHIRRRALDENFVLLPDNKIVQRFAEIVDPIMDQVLSLQAMNRGLIIARDLLLPKLMSGALDVSRITLPQEVAA